MISFVDTLPRYRIKVIDKFVTVEDRNYIQFFMGDTRVVDTLGDNRRQLDKITGLMRQIVEQQEFWVDTITLTSKNFSTGVSVPCYSTTMSWLRSGDLCRSRRSSAWASG